MVGTSSKTRVLDFTMPHNWQEMTQKQMRYALKCLAREETAPELHTHCFLKFAHIEVITAQQGGYLIKVKGENYVITVKQLAEAVACLSFIDDIPSAPVRLEIEGTSPLAPDFQGVPFGTYLYLENLYQGFIATRNNDLLRQMAKMMYPSDKDVSFQEEELIGCFYWFAALKNLFAKIFVNFLRPTAQSAAKDLDYHALRESMNNQIRALTKGDVTKNKVVMEIDTWQALTELDAQAREYDELKQKYKI